MLARLEEADLVLADTTDRGTWLRRVTYDLTGLPPTVDEVDAFVSDHRDDAFERQVDRLLASQAFGEHWGQHWLDLMRFAESKGHEQDFSIPHAWRYRDYVIRAFNANVRYDQLVIEHIAGDLLPEPRMDPETRTNQSIQATAWWHLGEATHSPVDIRGEEADRIDNQIDVFGKALLGMTVACARCHDHKFDAISTEDYYALCGFIQSSSYQEANTADPEIRGQIANRLAEHNRRGGRALFELYAALTKDRLGELHKVATPEQLAQLVAALAKTSTPSPPATEMLVHFEHETLSRDQWITSGLAFGDRPVQVGEILPAASDNHPPLRIAEHSAASNDQASPKLTGMYRTRTFEVTGKTLWYCFRGKAEAFLDVDSHRTVAGPLHTNCAQNLTSPHAWTWHAHSVEDYIGHRVHVDFKPQGSFALARICFADKPPQKVPPAEADQFQVTTTAASRDVEATLARTIDTFTQALQAVEQGRATTTDARRVNWLLAHHHALPPSDNEAHARLVAASKEFCHARGALENQLPEPQYALALLDGSAEDEHVHLRGNHKRIAVESTPRRFLTALGGSFPIEQGSGRLELAVRVASSQNPLTARVMINRVWAHLMGRGIVPTVDNLGVLGQPPTHPELLDYLATEFIDSGWDTKQLIRRLVLSSTYRQSSRPAATLDAKTIDAVDPANALIYATRVRRLTAESIRDAVLVVSGEIDPTPFGPSVPIHITDFMRHNRSPAGSGPLDGNRRRSIYIEVRRNAFHHFLAAFDKPIPSTTMGMRHQSNSASQPLMLLNDPLVHQLVDKWAAKLTREFASDEQAIQHAFVAAFARPPTPDEAAKLKGFIAGRMNDDATSDTSAAHAHRLVRRVPGPGKQQRVRVFAVRVVSGSWYVILREARRPKHRRCLLGPRSHLGRLEHPTDTMAIHHLIQTRSFSRFGSFRMTRNGAYSSNT